MVARVFKASVEGKESAGRNCGEDVGGAKDVVYLRLTSVVSGGNGGIRVLVFVDIDEVVCGEKGVPGVVSFCEVEAGVGIDHEYVVFVVVTERGE